MAHATAAGAAESGMVDEPQAGMLALRGYLVVPAVLLIVKVAQLALGQQFCCGARVSDAALRG